MIKQEFFEDIKNTYGLSPENFDLITRMAPTFPTDGNIYNPKEFPSTSKVFITYKPTGICMEYPEDSEVASLFYEDWTKKKFGN